MQPFIDLEGASGRTYRFRLWPGGEAHKAVAGNYVYVRWRDDDLEVMGVGATNDLTEARRPLETQQRLGVEGVYTRLNVPRRAREEALQDLIARYKPAFIGADAN